MAVCGRLRIGTTQRQARLGFTIVELLIVIVVVAILASVTIVAYQNIQSKAHDAAIRSDFRSIWNKLELYKASYGTYPHNPSGACANPSGAQLNPLLSNIDMKLSTGSYNTTTANTNLLYIASNDGQHFALLGYAKGNPTYYITEDVQHPTIYAPNPSVGTYPGGAACKIGENLGIPGGLGNAGLGYYYLFNQSSGGFLVWK